MTISWSFQRRYYFIQHANTVIEIMTVMKLIQKKSVINCNAVLYTGVDEPHGPEDVCVGCST